MMVRSRSAALEGRRFLAVLAAALLALALLPPAGAHGQTQPEQRTTLLACPAGAVPDAGFPDESPTFQHFIDCIVGYAIAMGRADGTYGPTAPITRGQMATFVSNLLVEAGVELTPAPAGTYTDTQGTTHEANILAISGTDPAIAEGFGDGTFRPGALVRRDQMASFIATAHEVITGERWEVVETDFTDVAGNVHGDNIARIAGAGVTVGTTPTTYGPRQNVTRGQMAAFFARHIDILVELGHVETRFSVMAALAVDPEEATNFVDDDHEFTVSAVSQTGAVVDVEATVYYEVYVHDTDTDTWELDNPEADRTAQLDEGVASFSYSRAQPQTEAVVACLLPPEENDGAQLQQDEAVCVRTDDDTLEDDLSNLLEELFATAAFKDWVEVDGSEAVRLNWQNELGDGNGPFYGNVDDVAAAVHGDEGSGTVIVTYNVEAGFVQTRGSVVVTSEIPDDGSPAGTNHHIHVGGIDANGPIAIALPTPQLEAVLDEPDEDGRGLFEYSLDGGVRDADYAGVLADIDAALDAADEGDLVPWYVNVHTVANPAGEVRGQIARTEAPDGGLSALGPVYKLVEPVGGETVDGFALVFDIDVSPGEGLAGAAGDFTVTVDGTEVPAGNPRVSDGVVLIDIEPRPAQDDDVFSVTIGDIAADAIESAEFPLRPGSAANSVRTRSVGLAVDNGVVDPYPYP